MGLVAQGDADPVVTYTDGDGGRIALNVHVDSGSGFAAMPQGIVQQVVKSLLDPERIRLDSRQISGMAVVTATPLSRIRESSCSSTR